MARKLYWGIVAFGAITFGFISPVAAQTATPDAASPATNDCTCGNKSVNDSDLTMYTTDFLKSCKDTLSNNIANGQTCTNQLNMVKKELDKRSKSFDDVLTIMPDRFDFHFDAGYEFTSVNNLWSKGNPRVALGLYRTMFSHFDMCRDDNGEGPENDCTTVDPVSSRKTGLGLYGVHLASEIRLTDTGEQTAVTVGPLNMNTANPQRALDFDIATIFPFYTDNIFMYGKTRREYWALEALWGAKKVDNINLMLMRRYFGLRTFVGPQSYVDVMLGRSQRANGTRLLIRGEMPFNFSGIDQIIYLGLEGNIALNNRSSGTVTTGGTVTTDTIRGYITWDIDNLLSQFAGK